MKAYLDNPKLHRAITSVAIVRTHLIDLGFEVTTPNHPNANGVDLTVMKDGHAFTVEVKSASRTTRSWRVPKCHTISDYIAIVMPNTSVRLEVMSDHLRLCGSDGSRHITRLVKLIELLEKA